MVFTNTVYAQSLAPTIYNSQLYVVIGWGFEGTLCKSAVDNFQSAIISTTNIKKQLRTYCLSCTCTHDWLNET